MATTDGLQLLMALMGGSGANLKDMALGYMLPNLPKIAKQLTMAGEPPPNATGGAAPGAMPGMGGPAGPGPGPGGGGIPPELMPFLALAARAQQPGMAPAMPRPPAPTALPRLATMDQG